MTTRSIAGSGSRSTLHRIHKILLIIFAVLFALLVLGGCVTKYQMRMHGVQIDPEQPLTTTSAVSVEKVPEIKASDRDQVVTDKITYLLEQRGFRVVERGQADYVLLFKIETIPVASRGTIGSPSGTKGGMSISVKGGPFQRVVDLHLIEAEPFRADGSEVIIWSGTAVLPEVPNTSPRFEDLLLVGAFEHFPEDTGAIVTQKISLNDPGAKVLHQMDPVSTR